MATPVWQSGHLYTPGSIVRRSSPPPAVALPIPNGSFESGDTAWTKDAGWAINTTGQKFSGTYSAEYNATSTNKRIVSTTKFAVTPGESITVSCQVNQGPTAAGGAGAGVELDWLTAADALIKTDKGNVVDSASNNQWKQSTLTAVAPAGAAKVQVACRAFRLPAVGTGKVWVDVFQWNYSHALVIDSLVYKAVQASPGYSGASEPAWPDTVGVQVIDNEVTWEAIDSSRVVWAATPILVSGATEPTWPSDVGQTIGDNGKIIWTAVNRRVTDEKLPHSKVVAIASSKIFVADEDIIPFSATVNPLDWSTPDDAGYLPFGLQTYGANPVAALGLYRSNLVAFNAAGFQMWQVDQDPANMAILDAMPIGSTYHKTVQPVGNDVAFLTNLGARSFSVSAASTSLQAGDFGKAIDPLVQEALIEWQAAPDEVTEPFGLYYPAQGQYWLFFVVPDEPDDPEYPPDTNHSEAFVLTQNGGEPSWSRYVFPEEVTDWTIHGEDLYLRTASDLIWKVEDGVLVDDFGNNNIGFSGAIWWHYLELGPIGGSRMLHGFDLVGTGTAWVSFGFEQKNLTLATTPYEVDMDTLTGEPIAMPITAPSIQLRLSFDAGDYWEWNVSVLYADTVGSNS